MFYIRKLVASVKISCVDMVQFELQNCNSGVFVGNLLCAFNAGMFLFYPPSEEGFLELVLGGWVHNQCPLLS